jgi:hypothetical protein
VELAQNVTFPAVRNGQRLAVVVPSPGTMPGLYSALIPLL